VGPDKGVRLVGFGGFDPTFQLADIIFQEFLNEIFPPQFFVTTGKNFHRGPVALFDIAAKGRDGFAEVFFIIGTPNLAKNGALIGSGAAGGLVILLEGIGNVCQIDG
jgi:hypothetical protein